MALLNPQQTPIQQTCDIYNSIPTQQQQCLINWDYMPQKEPVNPFKTTGIKQYETMPTVAQNYSFGGVKVKAEGLAGVDEESAGSMLQKAQQQKSMALGSSILSSASNIYNAYQYVKNVKATKVQYENQKKIIDANIANQETLMMENLQENMAQLNVITAAQNVDLSSEGVQAVKDKGLADMGKDIRDMREQGALNKKALDLDYALNMKNARQNFTNSVIAGGFDIGSTIFNFTG